ncbi:lysosomal alpha-glucosidase-like isoform X1 [Biomphalaria glabrata]|uniref:Lysosomal alpha-glucosidase-like isoform X1 n=1 Tax=Biomphalaria glabrata TaxID=6526 RepID=A0A9W2ZQN5_BIOGL|nr:lysosomal alpha-glucosidase-like isoform X1 [Biomphalaria glabrata]XP_055877337.1 lysosomal alpha-glucosidase-like isoform X1 [Biomphalaria glabrata]XP_055877338.1 lysosomal alpha-glucosidase-like isoform X1 [Biomphalaria glabrata]
MTIFKSDGYKPSGNLIWKPFKTENIKAQSKIKYDKLNSGVYQINLERHQPRPSKCIKALNKFTKFIGWALVLCALGCVGLVIYSSFIKHKLQNASADQCSVDENNRFDCWPEKQGATEQACLSRGCCWKASSVPNTAPYCFFPANYNGYNATEVTVTTNGIDATLVRTTSTFFSPDVKTIKLRVDFQNDYRLRVKFYDPSYSRYEVPLDVPTGSSSVLNPLYNVTILKEPFNIIITRVSTGATIFDTTNTAPLIFSDQYLQIATKLATKFLYGLGEHRSSFLQDVNTWKRLVFWNRDDVPKVNNNGYGTHPFFLNLESTGGGDAHGVFLLNSNAGEVALQPFGSNSAGALTYRFLGGILDFFIVLGPQPINIATQFAEIVGQTYFPPFWSLGFHLCKWGYTSDSELREVIERNRNASLPYDIQWTDIDYMDARKDWTYDKNKFAGLPDIVKDLHNNQQRYILMADPAISSDQPPGSYPPFDDGKQLDVFVKNASGDILIGSVWPGKTAFPDFFHPNALQYWFKQANDFHGVLDYDGLWIDMNEPSSFVDGSVTGCTSSTLDNPPFVPATIDGGSLISKTICPSAQHYISSHYNLHNMYGWSQANITRAVLSKVFPNKRSPIISRSSYAGSAKYTGHWLGDNNSDFDDLYYSIPGILNFNLFGVTFIGADICGFRGVTTPELCTRWMQLGAFYTFMRNHADISSPAQDPGSFQDPYKTYMRGALQLRYRLLAVLYTGLFRAHVDGLPVIRPLFYIYPGTETIDKQFMWGDSLMVIPVLDDGVRLVNGFIPNDKWYDFFTGAAISARGEYLTLNAPLDTINVLVRGGSILPLLPSTERTDVSRQQKFQILVSISDSNTASGELFWDDGESSDSITSNKYSLVSFTLLSNNTLVNRVIQSGYNPFQGIKANNFVINGVLKSPSNVYVSGNQVAFGYNADTKVLSAFNLDVDLLQVFTFTWN